MNNISIAKLKDISEKTTHLIGVINNSILWANKYKPENLDFSYELKKYRRKMRKIENVIVGKPVIAFFGASQVGKSYMVNSLLCNDSKKLFLLNHKNINERVDFIKEINPEGHGNESTSVITRFSTDKPDENREAVKLKLLSVKDIVCILCDSYYLDVKEKKLLSYEQAFEMINTQIHFFEGLISKETHGYISDDDIYDIQDYLEANLKHAGNNPFELFSKLGLWHHLSKVIPFISPDKWPEAFGILWNNNNYISKFFSGLVAELGKLNFSKYAYSGFSAVKRNQGAILDVQTLDGIYLDKNFIVDIQTEKGDYVKMKNSALCAICAEVIFSIEGNYSQELKNKITQNIDVLDFPGARTRLELQEDSIGDINVKEMILRGKVSYLFNSASANYEINNLFVCMRTSQTNVRGVPGLIKSWIDHNIGETPEERFTTLEQADSPPLFLIFTWWNTLLGYSSSTDSADPKERLDKWLKTRFKEEIIADFDWNTNWTKNGISTNKFHNYFLLRDFIKSYEMNKIFDRKYLDSDKTMYEEVVSSDEDQNKFLEDFKKDFIESDLVNNLFKDPLLNWNEASLPNLDGTEYILKNILKIANNHTRTKRYVNQLSQWTKELTVSLGRYHHSDNADEQILKAAREVAEIHGYMNRIFGLDAFNFGSFMEKLTVSEADLRILYHEKLNAPDLIQATNPSEWILFIESSPRLKETNSYEENLKIMQEDYYLDFGMSVKDTEDYFMNKYNLDVKMMLSLWNTQKEKSTVLAGSAVDFWYNSSLTLSKFEEFTRLGFDKSALAKLLENIQISFKRLGVEQVIAQSISQYVDRLTRLYEAEDMIAHITSGIINNFIHDLGWQYFNDDEKQVLENLNNKNNLRITFPSDEEQFEIMDIQTIDELFDFMSNLSLNLRKIPLDENIIRKIPMINNYKKWREMVKLIFISNCNIPNYDLESNRQLGEVLGKIKNVEFSLT